MQQINSIADVLKCVGMEKNSRTTPYGSKMMEILKFLRKESKQVVSASISDSGLFISDSGEVRENVFSAKDYFVGHRLTVLTNTGLYSFVVIADNPFYHEVCSTVGIKLNYTENNNAKSQFSVSAKVLDAIKTATKFTSKDVYKPATMGVLLKIKDNRLTVVATDSHKLFQSEEFTVTGDVGDRGYIIDIKSVPKTNNETVCVSEIDDDKLSILGMEFPIIDAKFPDYDTILNQIPDGRISVNRKTLIGKVKEVMPSANKYTKKVEFNFNGKIELSAQDIDMGTESCASMPYEEKKMDDFSISFNGKYLIDCLSAMKTDYLVLNGNTKNNPCYISDGTSITLLMPLN